MKVWYRFLPFFFCFFFTTFCVTFFPFFHSILQLQKQHKMLLLSIIYYNSTLHTVERSGLWMATLNKVSVMWGNHVQALNCPGCETILSQVAHQCLDWPLYQYEFILIQVYGKDYVRVNARQFTSCLLLWSHNKSSC